MRQEAVRYVPGMHVDLAVITGDPPRPKSAPVPSESAETARAEGRAA